MEATRKKVTRTVDESSVSGYLDGCTLDQAIEVLQKIKNDAAKRYPNFTNLRLDYRSDLYDGDTYRLYLIGDRDETDHEMNKRLQDESQAQAYRRQQYENLKKEFERSE